MTYLRWSSDLDTGIDVIDKQHRRIVEYLNELDEANDGGDMTVTKHVLNELIDYTLVHFSFEEDLQVKANYPYIKAHKRLHEMFTNRVLELKLRSENGENVTPELLTMLKKWLVNHIKGDDSDYVESVSKIVEIEVVEENKSSWLNTALTTDLVPIFKTALNADLIPVVKTALNADLGVAIKKMLR